MTKRLLTLAFILAFSAASVLGQGAAASVAGAWKVSGDVMGVGIDLACTFTQDSKKLTGTCKSAGESKATDITGEVDDKKVMWSLKTTYNGEEINVTFKGTLDDTAQLKGDIDVQPLNVGGTFSAKKDEAK